MEQVLDDFYIGESQSAKKPQGTFQVSGILDLSQEYSGQRLHETRYTYRPLDQERLESVRTGVREALDILGTDTKALVVAEDVEDALLVVAGALAIHCNTSVSDAKYFLKQRSSISEVETELLRKVEQACQLVLGECVHCGNLVPPHRKAFYGDKVCHSVCGAWCAEASEEPGEFELCRGSQLKR
ncbi:hypothetical protein KY092_08305 [Natronomonas gomsonensis]|uniref:hypothetical protein n=1 Tax=Natronomonas gomsonensis TaxID=1046043 RepID=UPI0020CA9B8D|nr:hypothetical protein [Natronomonas gomsonensis]MCY4730560.1 hypothetical protein [Natronomonas gomsonensis]